MFTTIYQISLFRWREY